MLLQQKNTMRKLKIIAWTSVLILIAIAAKIYDYNNERPFYYNSYNGKIIKVKYNLGKIRPSLYLNDSTEILPGDDIVNYEVGDSIYKDKNTYNLECYRKDSNGEYRKLKIVEGENENQMLEFE